MYDEPTFEVIPVDAGGHPMAPFRIWADGRVEGFPAHSIIINRIPNHTNQAVADAMDLRSS